LTLKNIIIIENETINKNDKEWDENAFIQRKDITLQKIIDDLYQIHNTVFLSDKQIEDQIKFVCKNSKEITNFDYSYNILRELENLNADF